MREMSIGVNSLHKRDIVHLDIKPANFLVFFPKRDGQADCEDPEAILEKYLNVKIKIADLGIARRLATGVSHVTLQSRTGSLLYMAPESAHQANSEKLLLRKSADVWSMGAVLHRLVLGYTPFERYCKQGLERFLLNMVDFRTKIDLPSFEAAFPEYFASQAAGATATGDETRVPELDGSENEERLIYDWNCRLIRGCLNHDPDQRFNIVLLMELTRYGASQVSTGDVRNLPEVDIDYIHKTIQSQLGGHSSPASSVDLQQKLATDETRVERNVESSSEEIPTCSRATGLQTADVQHPHLDAERLATISEEGTIISSCNRSSHRQTCGVHAGLLHDEEISSDVNAEIAPFLPARSPTLSSQATQSVLQHLQSELHRKTEMRLLVPVIPMRQHPMIQMWLMQSWWPRSTSTRVSHTKTAISPVRRYLEGRMRKTGKTSIASWARLYTAKIYRPCLSPVHETKQQCHVQTFC